MTQNFKEDIISRYQNKMQALQEGERQRLALESKARRDLKESQALVPLSAKRARMEERKAQRERILKRRRNRRLIKKKSQRLYQMFKNKSKQKRFSKKIKENKRRKSKHKKQEEQLVLLLSKVNNLEKMLQHDEDERKEFSIFNMLSNPQQFITLASVTLFTFFLALIIVEGCKGQGGDILKPSSWGVAIANIKPKKRFKIFSSTKGSKMWDSNKHGINGIRIAPTGNSNSNIDSNNSENDGQEKSKKPKLSRFNSGVQTHGQKGQIGSDHESNENNPSSSYRL